MTNKGTNSNIGESKPTDGSLDMMDSLVDDVLEEPGKEEEVKEQAPEESLQEQEDEPVDSEDSSKEEEEQKKEEPEDEDVIPRSKYEKTLEKMQRRIDEIASERDQLKSKMESTSSQDDSLESLSPNELSQLRYNAEDAILDAKVNAKVEGTDSTERITELRELIKRIDSKVKEAPLKFQQKQVKHLKSVMEDVKEIDPDIVNSKGELWNYAAKIFKSTPSLQKSETGQAEALALATEHYLTTKSVSNSREKTSTLSKKLSSLKRKTGLDVKNRVANADQVSNRKLRDKAIKGTYYDKLSYISKELVPDDFLQQ